jgi:hypothetical protein
MAGIMPCRARARPALVGFAVAFALAGCASISEKAASTLAEMPGIGLPADAPARPATPAAYPAVHDMPPPRSAAVLSESEVRKLEDELVAAREQQQASAGVKAAASRKQPPKPRADPVASRRAIY